ncbi:MAG: acyl-CoA dehydrogenase family protein, partial [Actinobacteria bacterium]|nr:acyl-CoA dehydrogenase family protein [Actinomycetota bacterium]
MTSRDNGRNTIGTAMSVLNRMAGARIVERLGLKRPLERAVSQVTRAGFQTVDAAGRTWVAAQRLTSPKRPVAAAERGLFDLTPTEDQQLVRDTVVEFAAEQLRPIAADADAKCDAPQGVLRMAAELGITALGVPEELGGVGDERSAVTNV